MKPKPKNTLCGLAPVGVQLLMLAVLVPAWLAPNAMGFTVRNQTTFTIQADLWSGGTYSVTLQGGAVIIGRYGPRYG